MNNSIVFRDVAFSYPQHAVFSQLNIRIVKGTVSAVVGENGTGKSTFAKLINGLLKPQSGEITVAGHPTINKSASELASFIGYVFQNPDDQIFHSSVAKEVAYGLHSGSRLTVDQALRLTGLSQFADSNPFDLSLAQRKFIAIASVLVMDTAVIIMDEPTAGQDRDGLQRLLHIMDWLKQQEKTVLVITHDMNFVAEHFHQVIALSEGRVQYQGSVRGLFRNDSLIHECGLIDPDIVTIGQQLGIDPVPLTVKELASYFN